MNNCEAWADSSTNVRSLYTYSGVNSAGIVSPYQGSLSRTSETAMRVEGGSGVAYCAGGGCTAFTFDEGNQAIAGVSIDMPYIQLAGGDVAFADSTGATGQLNTFEITTRVQTQAASDRLFAINGAANNWHVTADLYAVTNLTTSPTAGFGTGFLDSSTFYLFSETGDVFPLIAFATPSATGAIVSINTGRIINAPGALQICDNTSCP